MTTQPDDPGYQIDRIRGALTIDHRDLYATSATFHQGIDTLAQWLTVWVPAMATAAQAADSEIQQRIDVAQTAVPTDPELTDLMHNLDVSVAEARAARDRHVKDQQAVVIAPGDRVSDPATGHTGTVDSVEWVSTPGGNPNPVAVNVAWDGQPGASEWCEPWTLTVLSVDPLVNDIVIDPDGTRNQLHPWQPLGTNISDGYCLRCGRDPAAPIHQTPT